MKMEKRTFRIGHLANDLGLERFVIRFWEREFNIEPERSDGGQRYYTEADAYTFLCIKDLLYNKGLTIAGAKRCLKSNKSLNLQKNTLFATSMRTTIVEPKKDVLLDEAGKQKKSTLQGIENDNCTSNAGSCDMQACVCDIKKKLQRLREML